MYNYLNAVIIFKNKGYVKGAKYRGIKNEIYSIKRFENFALKKFNVEHINYYEKKTGKFLRQEKFK